MNDTPPTDLRSDIAALRREIEKLNTHRFVRIHNSYWRMIAFQFIRGLAMGLGTVIGATILVSVIAYFLSQIELIPIIGDWAAEIAQAMRSGQ